MSIHLYIVNMQTRSQDCWSIWLMLAHGNSMFCLQNQDGSILVLRRDSFLFTLLTLLATCFNTVLVTAPSSIATGKHVCVTGLTERNMHSALHKTKNETTALCN